MVEKIVQLLILIRTVPDYLPNLFEKFCTARATAAVYYVLPEEMHLSNMSLAILKNVTKPK